MAKHLDDWPKIKTSCSTCKFREGLPKWERNNGNKYKCSIERLSGHLTSHNGCEGWQLAKDIENELEYCQECNADTYPIEWFCSICGCDRLDSELFTNEEI